MKLSWYLDRLNTELDLIEKMPSINDAKNLEGNLGSLFPTLLKFNA